MRAKQSSTASGMYSRSGTLTPAIPIPILIAPAMQSAAMIHGLAPEALAPWESIAQGEGLLHDARNLMGAVGLYCDLLLIPGVLKPQHRRYAEELRLLGAQSGALMERLSLNSFAEVDPGAETLPPIGMHGMAPPRPASLRAIVERCSGLLSRVAGGRPIEVSYGEAASMPVLIAEEAVERILANLVRNAAAALDDGALLDAGLTATGDRAARAVSETPHRRAGDAVNGPVRQGLAGRSTRTADETPGAIRIGVGLLVNRVGESRPWPFQRVRLAVEDSGSGMTPERLEQVLSAPGAPSRTKHGIGLRVVQELVASSHGELRIMSAPGVGTRVQIEWPIAVLAGMDCAGDTRPSSIPARSIRPTAHPDSRRDPDGAPPRAATRQPPDPPASRRASLSAPETRASRLSCAAAEAHSTQPADSAARATRWASC